MPYKDKASKTAYQRDYMRRKRAGSNKGLTGSNKGLTYSKGLTIALVTPTAAKPVIPPRPFRSFSKSEQVGGRVNE